MAQSTRVGHREKEPTGKRRPLSVLESSLTLAKSGRPHSCKTLEILHPGTIPQQAFIAFALHILQSHSGKAFVAK